MIQIIPAVLATTPQDFKDRFDQIINSESFQEGWIHIDFADGEFVPNQTVGVEVVSQQSISLKREAHLMVVHPLEWIDKLRQAGFERVIFHYESKDDPQECIEKINEAGMEAGVALNIDTPVEKLEPFSAKIDLALIMAVEPGFQGNSFLPESINRVRMLKGKDWSVRISVDGGISDANARDLMEAGADQLTIGSYLLRGDIDENLEKIWEALK